MTKSFTEITPALKRRHAAEARFQWIGRVAIVIAIGFLITMVVSIAVIGAGALRQSHIALDVFLDPAEINAEEIKNADFGGVIKAALRTKFSDVTKRRDKRKLYGLVSSEAAYTLRDMVLRNPSLIGTTPKIWFIASDDIDIFFKSHNASGGGEETHRISSKEVAWINEFKKAGDIETRFNSRFFLSGDSREPELAGILSALAGSAFSLAVCFALSFPVGIMAAIYLEEFAPKNRWSDLIEVNINNLAAVPSIVFGLLGLAVLLNTFGLPRSSPLVGGIVLALMTLPTIIIASRAALRAVPPSIREAALGLGASQIQATFHHVAPLALPGMLTGAIVGMARALGETAPLLMIGMVAFIVDVPKSIVAPATALPVQIFLWADSPERAFLEKTCAAIIVLLTFLVVMNLAAVLLRRKFERRF
ncbi:MAG: phosphate ABC transporter permease PstA [Alphaproteobacteria bacterium]|nr:phosphate ABC transporter permease PstA [Alphaproteobacteria bacterium]